MTSSPTNHISRQSATATVHLRAGVYYLPETLALTEQDNGLTIAAYNNEVAVVSGGVLADNLTWKPSSPANPKVMVADLSNFEFPHGVKALQYGDSTSRVRATLARYPDANAERVPSALHAGRSTGVAPRGPLHGGRSTGVAPRGLCKLHGGVADFFYTDVRAILMVLWGKEYIII